MKRTGPSNNCLKELITELRIAANSHNSKLWKRVAEDLSKPARQRRVVNLSKINRSTNENDIIIVPGKVLGAGDLNHKIKVAAWAFSDSAVQSIKKNKSEAVSINELIKEDPKGKRIRIIG